jgi:hypothetical protein
LTNENVGDISKSSGSWIGKFDPLFAGQWTDLFVAMVSNLFLYKFCNVHQISLQRWL